jgi:hypothetical protein
VVPGPVVPPPGPVVPLDPPHALNVMTEQAAVAAMIHM